MMNAGRAYMAAVKNDRPARVALARTGLVLAGFALVVGTAGIDRASEAVNEVLKRALGPDPRNN
jgi:hypothetical protein